LKIIDITLPIFLLALIGFFYSKRVNPDLSGSNKLIVDIALPILIFISLSAKSFNPTSALTFTGVSIGLILLSGLIALPLARFSGASPQAFLPCVMFTNVGPVGIPLIALAYGPESIAFSVVLLVISNVLHFTLGAGVMSGKVDWRTLYANPLIWATLLGVFSSEMGWVLPTALHTSLTMISSHDVDIFGREARRKSNQGCQSGGSIQHHDFRH
jgi:predicted permease